MNPKYLIETYRPKRLIHTVSIGTRASDKQIAKAVGAFLQELLVFQRGGADAGEGYIGKYACQITRLAGLIRNEIDDIVLTLDQICAHRQPMCAQAYERFDKIMRAPRNGKNRAMSFLKANKRFLVDDAGKCQACVITNDPDLHDVLAKRPVDAAHSWNF